MNVHKEEFTLRQFMEEKDFEFHHYLDPVPPEVPFHEHPFYEIFFLCPEMSIISLKDVLISSVRVISC